MVLFRESIHLKQSYTLACNGKPENHYIKLLVKFVHRAIPH